MSEEIDLDERFPNLTPVSGPPSLFTVNGCGLMMYGARDHDLETGTYIKTHCLTFLFIPILALRSYRVADAESGGWYFIGREPVSGFAWGWNILFAASVVLGVGGAIVGVAIHEMDRHANGPDMVAERELEEANALAEKQEWVPAAQKYAKLIRDRSPVKSEAQVRLEDLYAAAEENANAVDFAQLMDLGTELNDEQIFIKNLLKIGLRGVERFAESDPKQAHKILANVDRLLLDGMRVAPLDVKRLAKLRRKVLSKLVAADPGDMTIVGQYCELLEADGEFDTCRKLLEPHAGALGATEGARILGRIYSREGKSDKAHALLVPYCKQRLQVLHAAEKKFNAAYESFETRIIDEVNSHRGHDQFRAGLKGLDQAQKRAAQRKYIAERIKYDPAVNSARKDFQQAAGVVPVAMELGVLQLQRARRMSDPAERKRELKQAEETFLAIQSAAGNDDTYRLQLGQVYYWLGREAEGRKLFDELLAARKRAPVILLTVARELRRLGAESEARRLAEEAFNTSKRVPVKQAAAAIRSLLTDDLDEKIIWLKRARQDSDAIQAELNLTLGRVAVRDGRRTDAEGHFRKAITLYGKLPESATSLNNSARIWNELYEITRNESDFEEVTRRMKKAVSLSPTSPILMGNTGSFLIRGALQSLLNGNVDLKTLEMTASIGVIGYLYRNQQERDEWIAKIRKRAGIRDGMAFLNNAVTLSPKGTRHYTELFSLELFLHDVEALRELKRRIVAANVDTETQTKQMLDYLGGKDLKKRLTQYQKSIERQRASVEKTKSKKDLSFAIARTSLANSLVGFWKSGGDVNADEVVKLAEAAHRSSPSVRTSSNLASGYAFRALQQLGNKNGQVKDFIEKHRLILPPIAGVTLLLARNDDVSKALASDPDVMALMKLVRDGVNAFPEDIDINEWVLLKHIDPAAAESLAERVRKNDRFRLRYEISFLLEPTSPSTALSLYWLKTLDGHDAEAKQVLENLRKLSIDLPVGK